MFIKLLRIALMLTIIQTLKKTSNIDSKEFMIGFFKGLCVKVETKNFDKC